MQLLVALPCPVLEAMEAKGDRIDFTFFDFVGGRTIQAIGGFG